MRRFTILTILLAAAGGPGEAAALTFLDLVTGDEALIPDARSAALGRTRAAGGTGGFTAATNPAHLARARNLEVMIGAGVQKMKETRSISAFDSFDGFLVESSYALNDKYQEGQGYGVTSILGSEGMLRKVGVGVSWAPVWDFNYDYSEEVRDNNPFTQPRDRLIALNEVQSEGTISAFTFGIGVAPREWVAAGASLQYLEGDSHFLHRTLFVQESRAEATRVDSRSLSGYRGVFGLNVRPDHRLDASASWKTETTLDGGYRRQGDLGPVSYLGAPAGSGIDAASLDITYPQELVIGVAYRPRAKLRTTIRVEAGWTDWSAYANGLYDELKLDDVWDARFGIEHEFYNGLPVRFGFLYRPSPQDDEVTTTAFTIGGGLDVGPLRADVAIEVANRVYRFDDLFDDAMFGGRTRSQQDLVEENATSAFFSLSTELEPLGGLVP